MKHYRVIITLFVFLITIPAWSQRGDYPDISIPLGSFKDVLTVNKFGRNVEIDTNSDPEDIWDGGGVWAAPTTNRVHKIASSSAADTNLTVVVQGLDSLWDLTSETITTDGTDSVSTTNSYVIIHRMYVSAGNGVIVANAGNITAHAVTDNTVTAQISIGNNQTLMAIYGVPRNYTALATNYYSNFLSALNNPATAAVKINLWVKEYGGVWQVKNTLGNNFAGSSHFAHNFNPFFVVQPRSLIKVQVLETSDNDADVAGGFDLILIKNEQIRSRDINYDF